MVSMIIQSSTISFDLLSLLFLIDHFLFLSHLSCSVGDGGDYACTDNSGDVGNQAWSVLHQSSTVSFDLLPWLYLIDPFLFLSSFL